MAPKRTTGDSIAVVRALLERWPRADEVDRHVALWDMGPAPEANAVPYKWFTDMGTKMLQGEYHTKYNAIRRAVWQLEKAGEVRAYTYSDTGRLAWIVTTNCNNGGGATVAPPPSE